MHPKSYGNLESILLGFEEKGHLRCVSEAWVWRLNERRTGGGTERSVREDKGAGYNQHPGGRDRKWIPVLCRRQQWQELRTNQSGGAIKGTQRRWRLTGVHRRREREIQEGARWERKSSLGSLQEKLGFLQHLCMMGTSKPQFKCPFESIQPRNNKASVQHNR